MFNGFDAFGYTGARPCTERCLRRFPGSGSGYNAQSNRCDLRSGMSELSGCRCGCPRGPRADKLRLIGLFNIMEVKKSAGHATSRPTPEGTSERVPCDKGKRPAKAVGSPDRAPTMRDLCEQGVHFVGTLIDRVHDTGRVVRLLTERNLALWAENKELKAGTGLEAVAAAEKRATELSAEVDWLKVTYELGYRVVLERFRAKYPESSVEEDPFAKWSEDANIRMEACQPFDDSTLPEE
ncbi:hypothetical protein BHM03_00052706 [Ensete ventricosum]|nr:hypothetical protein BHM03_00052706 [Ensete ventricosum]